MNKNQKLISIFLVLVICCGRKMTETANWFPVEPEFGESIDIVYNPHSEQANLIDVSEIILICEFYSTMYDSILIIPMYKHKNYWKINIEPPQETYLMSFKVGYKEKRTNVMHFIKIR